jgi:hypothetical protein
MRADIAFSMSIAWVSLAAEIATAAAISDGLNSKKSIPALSFHPPKH